MALIKRLQESEPFNHLPVKVYQEIRAAAVLRKYLPGTYIFQQNAPPTGFLYVIKEGLVEIVVASPGGVEMVVDYRKEGQFFGGTPIFTGEPYTGGARTVKATECYLIPQGILHRAELDCPQMGEYFTRIAFSRVRRLYQEIVSDHGRQALTQMEAYPFKKRLSEIMVAPVRTCAPEDSVQDVARRMTAGKVGSLLVLNRGQEVAGIITERDLVAKVVAPDQVDLRSLTAGQIMKPLPCTLTPDTFMYEAMAFMTAHGLKYLPVVDRNELVGIVSLRDLMRYRSQKAMLLIGNIREEPTLEGLAEIRREIVTVAGSLLSESRSTPEVMEILSYIHHRIIHRVYELCRQELEAEGLAPPPVRHCFLVMGSGGRREMLLGPDQDNALIFEDVPDDRMPAVEAYFVPLAEKIVKALDRVGYPLCQGKVMVTNPAWRGRLKDWEARIRNWVVDPEPQNVRYSSIFFDFVPLVGDPALAQELRGVVFREIREYTAFLYHMMSLDLRNKVPLGLLGRFIPEKSGENQGKLSLKFGGTVYIVDCIRMFALEKELPAVTTLDRLEGLVKLNVFSAETAEHIRAAFEALTFLRLRNEIELVSQGRSPSHYIDPTTLSRTEQDLLKEAFHAVSKLQDAAKRHFARTPF